MGNDGRSNPEQEGYDPTVVSDWEDEYSDTGPLPDDMGQEELDGDVLPPYGDEGETVSAAFQPRYEQGGSWYDPVEEEFDAEDYSQDDETESEVYPSEYDQETSGYDPLEAEDETVSYPGYDDGDKTVSAAYHPEQGQNPAVYDVSQDSANSTVYADSANYQSNNDGPPPVTPAKKPRKKWLIPCIAAAVLIIAAAIAIPILREQNNIKRYNNGADLLESGDYQGAYDVFKELGDYEDASVMAEYARRGVAYTAAKELMDKKDYAAAAETFEGLYGFKDSRELAGRCRKEISYQRAVSLFDAEDYAGAKEVFAQLAGFRESDDYVTRCEKEIAYLDAVALFEAEDYTRAKEAFSEMSGFRDSDDYVARCRHELADIAYKKAFNAGNWKKALEVLDSGEGSWENEAAMRTECKNHITYDEAVADLAKGLNYTAYKKFKSLGSFLDAREKAKSCVVSKPANGEVYHNPNYRKAISLIIKTPDDGNFNYIKIYAVGSDGNETLVSTVFIRANKKVTVKLPAGTYVMKCAYGSGNWFGEKDMFGDEGSYYKLVFSDGAGNLVIKKNYLSVTVTLRSGAGGNVGSTSEPRGTF